MKTITRYSKENRKKFTKSENDFRIYLLHQKIKFRTQRPIDMYIVDFLLPLKMAIVEIDGDYHMTELQKTKDRKRQAYIENKGFSFYRLTNQQVYDRDFEGFLAWYDGLALTTETNPRKIYGRAKY